jgi:hypothetical protein
LKIGNNSTRNEAGSARVLYSRKFQLMLYSLACVTRLDEQAWRSISHQKTRAKATASEALRLSSLSPYRLPSSSSGEAQVRARQPGVADSLIRPTLNPTGPGYHPNWTDNFGGPLKPGCQASARPARSAGTVLELGTICSLHSRSHLSNRIGTFVQYGVMPWYHKGTLTLMMNNNNIYFVIPKKQLFEF